MQLIVWWTVFDDIFSQGNQGPPGIPGPIGAPGLGVQGEKVKNNTFQPLYWHIH